MAMRITDLAARGGAEPSPELIDTITVMVQELADEQEIPYLKIVGGDIVGAAGFLKRRSDGGCTHRQHRGQRPRPPRRTVRSQWVGARVSPWH